MIIFDTHLDLAMNALEWNRDLTQPIHVLRERERGMKDKPDRGNGTVCLPEMRSGGVALCVATQIARVEHDSYSPVFGWRSREQAWAQTQGQLAWYRAMEEAGEMTLIQNAASLQGHLDLWQTLTETSGGLRPSKILSDQDRNATPSKRGGEEAASRPLPIGYVLSLEGADSILTLKHLERAYEYGLRAIGPAHYGPGFYANGTDASGGLNTQGRALLEELGRLNMILDVTHLCDECFWDALKIFSGPIWASHQNCRALVPHARQFSDEQIKALIERGAIFGAALDAWMMMPGWVRGKTMPEQAGLKLERAVDHIDHVCQIAGNARHCAIGSDLDGAFGREQTPADLDTIADLSRIPDLLAHRGYQASDVEAISHGNALRFLQEAWK
jgi:membrane dipeptidase